MSVDPRYLIAAWGFEILVLGLAMAPVLFYSSFRRVARLTSLALCCAWCGVGLVVWRDGTPDSGRWVLAPGLLLLGSQMFYHGLRELFGLRAPPRWERALPVFAFLSLLIFWAVDSAFETGGGWRALLVAVPLAVTPAHWLYEMVRSQPAPWSAGTRFLALGAAGAALLNGGRALAYLVVGSAAGESIAQVSAVAVAGFMVNTMVLGVGLLLEVQYRTNSQWMTSNIRLNQEALTDSLTNIGNRRHFDIVAAEMQGKVCRNGTQLSLLMLDIDNFKAVNDRFGHEAGDQVLRDVVAICRKVLRDGDLFTRWGGEEFAILLPDAPPRIAEQVANRILVAVQAARPSSLEGGGVTVSIGVASVAVHAPDIVDTQRRADRAMLDAKRAGRNRCFVAPSVALSAASAAG